MSIEEYVAKRNELNHIVTQCKRELSQIRNQYIREHCEYKIGDKVHVIIPTYISQCYPNRDEVVQRQELDAFVCQQIDFDDTGAFWPTLHKAKKDGTESIQYLYLPREAKPIITKIK